MPQNSLLFWETAAFTVGAIVKAVAGAKGFVWNG